MASPAPDSGLPLAAPFTSTTTAGEFSDGPCVRCLALLTSWIPEDGVPPLCLEGEDSYTQECSRCKQHAKNCWALGHPPRNWKVALRPFKEKNRDLVAIKSAQEELRRMLKAELDLEYQEHYTHTARPKDEVAKRTGALSYALAGVIDKYHKRNKDDDVVSDLGILEMLTRFCGDELRKVTDALSFTDEFVLQYEITKRTGALSFAVKGAIDKYRKSNDEVASDDEALKRNNVGEVVSDLEMLEMMVEDIKGKTPDEVAGDAADNIGLL